MNIKKENDFVIKVKTPTTLISKHISLNEKSCRRSVSQASKCSKHHRSSQSLSYSDSFDSDSPVKTTTVPRVKRVSKPIYHVSSLQNKKIKKTPCNIASLPKTAETTQKLLEANQLEINELISENANLRRQLLENVNELKTVQNQNKIQERYLNKVNSRDADVPTIIARYNAELHSLQEQLRRKKERLDVVERQKAELDSELVKAKKKIEKLKALVADKQLQEREDLSKKLLNLNDSLDVEIKKNADLERSLELLSKKHNYQMTLEANKYKELKQSYNDTLNELKNIRSNLKEKTKMLEMQNIYSKRVVRAPHRLSGKKGKSNESDESNFTVPKITAAPLLKPSLKKEDKHPSDNEDKKVQINNISKVKYQIDFKKFEKNTSTAVQYDIENDKKVEENKKSTKILFYGDTPSEISEIEEKSESKFSEVFEAVRRNMQTDVKVDNNNSNKDDTQKSELLAKLKLIDDKKNSSSNHTNKSLDLVEENLKKIMKEDKQSDSENFDVFCTSESEDDDNEDEDDDDEDVEENYSCSKSDSSSPCLLVPRGHAGLMGLKKCQNKNIKKETTQFEFLGFSVNTNNSNSENYKVVCSATEKNTNYLSDCEEIKID